MNYLYIVMLEYNDGTTSKKGIYSATDKNDCMGSFHTELGKAEKAKNIEHGLILAVDVYGGYVMASARLPLGEG